MRLARVLSRVCGVPRAGLTPRHVVRGGGGDRARSPGTSWGLGTWDRVRRVESSSSSPSPSSSSSSISLDQLLSGTRRGPLHLAGVHTTLCWCVKVLVVVACQAWTALPGPVSLPGDRLVPLTPGVQVTPSTRVAVVAIPGKTNISVSCPWGGESEGRYLQSK